MGQQNTFVSNLPMLYFCDEHLLEAVLDFERADKNMTINPKYISFCEIYHT